MNVKPAWLDMLLAEIIHEHCRVHHDQQKNMFCVNCCAFLIVHIPNVRRYDGQEVIQLNDLGSEGINCARIKIRKM
ncbi:hypothetical protein VNO77_01565 [Canavalia gladiata]|uniref:Uncharacterized protein n=1 Tax=Canavalia gladiata TaxID=3824 RepID=A0AAN9MW81_CANGL